MRVVTFPEDALPAKITVNPELRMDDNQYFAFCMANPDLRFERISRGEIVIVPPAGGESDYQCVDAIRQLSNWAKRDGRGKAFGSSVEFILPTNAALSPDAAWVSNQRLAPLSKKQRREFLPVSPQFIVELMSPSDRLRDAQKKMEEWIRGGVDLGWLIQPDQKTIYIYRAGQHGCEKRAGMLKLSGEGPVAGFELDLTDIWAGL